MDPKAPHFRHMSSGSSKSDLASVFSNLSSSSATVIPSASTSSGSSTQVTPGDRQAVIKFEPRSQGHDFVERARREMQEQSDLIMRSKLLQLSEQVNELIAQRAATDQRLAENDQVIKELRSQVSTFKGRVNSHHTAAEACKQLNSQRAHESHKLETRIDEMQKALEQKTQQATSRLDNIESRLRKIEGQVTKHTQQLNEDDERIDDLQDKIGKTKPSKGISSTKPEDGAVAHRVAQLETRVDKQECSQNDYEGYLKQVGENLVDHQNRISEHHDKIKTASDAISKLHPKVEALKAVHPRLQGQEEYQAEGRILKMDPTAAAIYNLQSQVTTLENDLQATTTSPQGSSSDSSTANEIERLACLLDETRGKVLEMTEQVDLQAEYHKHMTDISLATKLRLESMFFQLTKEYLGKCKPGEKAEYDGLDQDQLFILRQHVLEHICLADMVHVEFDRLKQMQEMPR